MSQVFLIVLLPKCSKMNRKCRMKKKA